LKKLYRSSTNKVVAGVCGGLAEYFGVDPTLIRVALVISVLIGGIGILAYIIAVIIIPTDDSFDSINTDKSQNIPKMRVFQEDSVHQQNISPSDSPKTTPLISGSILIIIGLVFLMITFGWIKIGSVIRYLLPVGIIIAGILLLINNMKR